MEINDIYGEKEAKKLEDYINNYYCIKVPSPQPPSEAELSFWKLAGFEAISFSIPALAMVLFSAIRTGGFFFVLEKGLLQSFNIPEPLVWAFSFIIMLAALFGFEGYALARGMKQGRESMRIEENKAGTIFTFIIIVSVGIFSGLGLIKNIPENVQLFINVLMAIITGLGAGIITFFGGKDIGIAIKKFDLERIRLQEEFQSEFNKWRESAVASYISVKRKVNQPSPIPSNNQPNPDVPEEQINHWRRLLPTLSFEDLLHLANLSPEQEKALAKTRGVNPITITNWKKNAISHLSRNPISSFVFENRVFPTFEQVNQLGVSINDLAQFVIENEQSLVKIGLVSQETADTIKSKVS